MQQSSIIKSSVVIMILTIISKIMGFLREIFVASAYGTTYETDAYNISLTIPILAFALIGATVSTVFIPIFTKILKECGRDKMYIFANKILVILFGIILIIYLLMLFQMENIIKILAPNFDEEALKLAIELSRISSINLIFLSIYSVFSAILQTLQEFVSVALVSIVINIPILIYVIFFNNYGIIGLTIVNVIGYIFEVLIQLPSLIKNKYRFKIVFDFRDKIFKEIPMLLLPVIMGVGVSQLNTFVDQIVASGLQEGTISAVNLSNKINLLIYSIYASSIITAIYPVLAGEVEKVELFKKHISKGICSISLIMIPSALGMMILCREIVKVMFERGVFNNDSVIMTATSLFFLTIGSVFYAVRDVISKAFYSLQDTITPMKNAAIGVLVNIVLDIILAKKMGIGGLSLATSMSAITTAVLLYIELRKKLDKVFDKDFISDLLKILFSSLIMGGCIYLLRKLMIGESNDFLLFKLVVIVIIGATIYIGILRRLKIDVFKENVQRINRKVKVMFNFK